MLFTLNRRYSVIVHEIQNSGNTNSYYCSSWERTACGRTRNWVSLCHCQKLLLVILGSVLIFFIPFSSPIPSPQSHSPPWAQSFIILPINPHNSPPLPPILPNSPWTDSEHTNGALGWPPHPTLSMLFRHSFTKSGHTCAIPIPKDQLLMLYPVTS